MSVYRSTWVALVQALSSALVTRLAAQGLPPLTTEIDGSAGSILIGPQYVYENLSPPRVLMIPRSFPFENSRDVVSPTGVAHLNKTWDPRAIGLQWKTYEVQCWGCNFTDQVTPAPDPALDYDAAQILCEMVWQSAQAIAAGVWRTTSGKLDENAIIRFGRVITFDLAFSTPVPDFTLPYAPSNVRGNLNPEIVIGDNPPEPP